MNGSPVEVEVRLDLKLSPKDIRALQMSGKHGVRNAMRTVSKYALEPAREEARRLSGNGIGRAERRFRTGRGGQTTYTAKGGKQRKIRSYRSGVRKKGAYAMRGRADSIGDVTLLLSIKTNTDYYNFLANLWEHGWTNVKAGTKHPGNQFMTKAVKGTLGEIRDRYARVIRAAVENKGRRLRASDLKRLG